jgi:hypothetical protein
VSLALDADARLVDDILARAAFDRSTPPREVRWETVDATFGGAFAKMQSAATDAAETKLRLQATADAAERGNIATVLREDAERYRADRLTEVDAEEKTARVAEEQHQVLLFEMRSVTGFQARRAAIETHLKKRLEEIAEFQRPRDPGSPQPLGVLFVFPTDAP